MEKRNKFIYFFILLFVVLLLFLNSSHFTGLVTNSQKLIVSLTIHSDQELINPGENLLVDVSVREPGGSTDETSVIDLSYSVTDSEGKVVSSKKESGVVAVKQEGVTGLLIPSNAKPGVYTASVDVSYKDEIYTASKTFEIISDKNNTINYIFYSVIVLLVLVLMFMIIIKKTTLKNIFEKVKTRKNKPRKKLKNIEEKSKKTIEERNVGENQKDREGITTY